MIKKLKRKTYICTVNYFFNKSKTNGMTSKSTSFGFRKYSFLLLFSLISISAAWSQVVFWSDDFNNGCASDCIANTYGGWTIVDNVDGVSGGAPNNWFVSCAEDGIAPPGCGSSCIGDASLHIGANPGAGGDMGATYNETGATNATYRLAVSPTISTVGLSSITLNFDFIAYGSEACSEDRAQLRLSYDNGATWPVGLQYCLTSVCCGPCNGYSQGQWTLYTLALPALFENNPNVRVGFHWRNNGNGSGTDPAVAIDDIRLSYTAVVPLKLIDFAGRTENNKIKLNWTSAEESNFSHFEVERSLEAKNFTQIGRVEGKGNLQSGLSYYTFVDPQSAAATVYYRLKMVDYDGSFEYSKIISVANNAAATLALDNLLLNEDLLKYRLTANSPLNADIEVYDLQGKVVLSQKGKKVNAGVNNMTMDVSKIPSGVYLINIKTIGTGKGEDITEKFFRS